MNIYNDSNYASQSSLPSDATFDSITANDIIIPNSQNGDILFTNASKEINGLNIGPINYLLQSSSVEPQWTNIIKINTITSLQYIIPGTAVGDLFTVTSGGALERVAIGTAGQKLISNGSIFEWAFNGNQYFTNSGTGNNINSSLNIIFGNTFNLVSGNNYKITVSGNYTGIVVVNFIFEINSIQIITQSLENTGPMTRVFYYNATVSGTNTFSILGNVSSSYGTLSDYNIFCELYN